MERSTGYAMAVARALQHRAANVNVPGPASMPGGERAEWVWLLHDDSEPAPDALEQLLRGAAETRAAAVLGPKVKDWADRQVVLETGVTIDTAGRRITGIEPREVDQGQHDGDRDALAVGSAGMLVRRDVWDDVGGFDTGMALFREDVDFCWRVHAAGYRVRVITDAVVYHVEASARRRRPISIARRPRPARPAQRDADAARQPPRAADAGRRPRATLLSRCCARCSSWSPSGWRRAWTSWPPWAPCSAIRSGCWPCAATGRRAGVRPTAGCARDLPPGRSLRRIAEFAAASLAKSGQVDTAGLASRDRRSRRGRLPADRHRPGAAHPDPPRRAAVLRADRDRPGRRAVAVRLRPARRRRAGARLGRRVRPLARVSAGLPPGRGRLRRQRSSLPGHRRRARHGARRQALARGGRDPARLRAAGGNLRVPGRAAGHPFHAVSGSGRRRHMRCCPSPWAQSPPAGSAPPWSSS